VHFVVIFIAIHSAVLVLLSEHRVDIDTYFMIRCISMVHYTLLHIAVCVYV